MDRLSVLKLRVTFLITEPGRQWRSRSMSRVHFLKFLSFSDAAQPSQHWRCRKTFTDPRLCAAIIDRLTFGGNIIETGTDSYRLARTKARTAARR